MRSEIIATKVTPAVADKLRNMAERERRTVSQYVWLLLEKHTGITARAYDPNKRKDKTKRA